MFMLDAAETMGVFWMLMASAQLNRACDLLIEPFAGLFYAF